MKTMLSTPSSENPGQALEEFLAEYTELWHTEYLKGSSLNPRDIFDAIGVLVDTRFTTGPAPTRLTWEHSGLITPDNNPVLSQESLIGQLLVSIRREIRALMLKVSKLGIPADAHGQYVLTIRFDSIELNDVLLWSKKLT